MNFGQKMTWMIMILLIEYFTHDNKERDKEYLKCLQMNIDNPLISRIEVFISDASELDIVSDKLFINKQDERPTYKNFFDFCNNNHKGEICIVSNSDIWFDDTLSIINKDMKNKFLALSRWDVKSNGDLSFFNREDSQDSWIFKPPITFKNEANFCLGKPGCDNRIAYMAHESGLLVTNPSKLIVTSHLHLTHIRNYTAKDTIRGMHCRVKPNDKINGRSELTLFMFN